MTDNIAIRVDGVSKSFKLPHEKTSSIKGAVINFSKRKKGYETQQALKDISFEVNKGDFFGIVGRNGSGKSTLLKLIAEIYTPDSGKITVNGKLTPFIELGVGFNPELSGRDNVFLNGALLGFSRKEMEAKYDEIVEFAEIERFMDQKLKNYSSGMQVRLAFSIAIQANSDILVLDEVLAVGDEAFQQKCVDIFEKYKANKQTIVLVTHDMESVRRFCNKAILLSDGQIIEQGQPSQVASKYSKLNRDSASQKAGKKVTQKSPIKLQIKDKPDFYKTGDEMKVMVSWDSSAANVKNVGVGIIKNSGEFMFGSNTFRLNKKKLVQPIEFTVKLNLTPGKYHLMAGLFGETRYDVIEFLDKGTEFLIIKNDNDNNDGMARLDHTWSL